MVFQGHPPNFKVTRDRKSLILTGIERFRTVTPVWIIRPVRAIKSLRFALFVKTFMSMALKNIDTQTSINKIPIYFRLDLASHIHASTPWCFMSIFLLVFDGDTPQNIHFNVFILHKVMCYVLHNDIWTIKTLAFHSGIGTKDVGSKLWLSRLIVPPEQRSCWGYIGFTPSVRPSLHLSRLPCLLCNIYSSGWILSILATNDHYHERVCRTQWPMTLTYIVKVIRPSLRKLCPLCSVYSSGWIIFIFGTNDHYHYRMCRVLRFFQNLKNLIFGKFLKNFGLDLEKKNLQFLMDSYHI